VTCCGAPKVHVTWSTGRETWECRFDMERYRALYGLAGIKVAW